MWSHEVTGWWWQLVPAWLEKTSIVRQLVHRHQSLFRFFVELLLLHSLFSHLRLRWGIRNYFIYLFIKRKATNMSNNNAWLQTSTATPLRLQMSTTSMSTKVKRHDCCMSFCQSVTTNLSEVDRKADSPEVKKNKKKQTLVWWELDYHTFSFTLTEQLLTTYHDMWIEAGMKYIKFIIFKQQIYVLYITFILHISIGSHRNICFRSTLMCNTTVSCVACLRWCWDKQQTIWGISNWVTFKRFPGNLHIPIHDWLKEKKTWRTQTILVEV